MWKKLKSVFNPNPPPELTTLFSPPDPELLTDFQKALYAPPVCYSEKFPGIRKPKPATAPELIAAKWASGEIYPEQTPGIAADLLESGLDTPSMRRLAGEMRVGCRADVEDLVVRMLKELGVKVPASETQARMLATRQIAREVVAGMRNPWKAASDLERIWTHEIWHHKDLCDVAQLLEELDCLNIARGRLPQLTEELVELFARLGAYAEGEKRPIRFGLLEGKGWIADDFDAPLPDDLLAQFEGRDDPPWK